VALGRWLRPSPDAWQDHADTITVTSARNRRGGRLRFVSNWSWEPQDLTLPVGVTDVLAQGKLHAGDVLPLGAWDVRVLLESPGEHNEEERQ